MIFLKNLQLIQIHPILYIFIILSFFTGTMGQLFILLTIIVIHELGHFIAARFFHWHIEKVIFWVFGAVMITSEFGVRKIHEDLIVTIAGPMQHVIIFIFLHLVQPLEIIPPAIIEIAFTYNYILFIFNLLPIFPLDGGKIFFYFLAYFLPYRMARRYVILISLWGSLFIICMQIVFLPFTLTSMLLMVFIFMENRTEWKQQYYHFIRFLLNRFYYPNAEGKQIILQRSSNDTLLTTLQQFYLYKRHIISIRHDKKLIQYSESTCLMLFFLKNYVTYTFENIIMGKNSG